MRQCPIAVLYVVQSQKLFGSIFLSENCSIYFLKKKEICCIFSLTVYSVEFILCT